jgi:hypothetical protein
MATVRSTVNIRVLKAWLFTTQGSYNSPQLTLQGEDAGQYTVTLSLQRGFLNDALRLTLTLQDVARSQRTGTVFTTGGFEQRSLSSTDSRVLMFSVRYRFSNQNGLRNIRRDYRANQLQEGA